MFWISIYFSTHCIDKFFDLIKDLIHEASDIETLRDIVLEIDCSQAEALKTIVRREIPTASIEVIKDLSGLDRVISIHIS